MDAERFFQTLSARAESDTRVAAALRRSLSESPGTEPATFPWIEPHVGTLSERERRMVYLAAGLWAVTQRRTSGRPQPLVEAVAHSRRERRSGSVEQRFVALLDADDDELVWRLRHIVQLVASDQTAIDWPQLLRDLWAWSHPERIVQRRWARQFWGAESTEGQPATMNFAEPRAVTN